MIPRVTRTTSLALGLIMIWLGVFYSYELKLLASRAEAMPGEVVELVNASEIGYKNIVKERTYPKIAFTNEAGKTQEFLQPIGQHLTGLHVGDKLTVYCIDESEESQKYVASQLNDYSFPFILACSGLFVFMGGVMLSRKVKEYKKKKAR